MKRFIRYLYEYQQGKRIRNVGFVKVEQEESATVVHIHGKGLHLTGRKVLKIYIFYVEKGKCIGIWQGEIEHVNPAVNYRLRFTPEDTGRPDNYPLIDGVILENENQRRFAAVWDDMPAAVDNMQLWKGEPEADILEMVRERAAQEEDVSEPTEQVSPGRPDQPSEDILPEDTPGLPNGGADSHYMKIRRQDIARLKRCEWRLANNSFLLHGYYNYHHLLLIQEEDACYLGVPGVYHPREARAAEAFGFPKFLRLGGEELQWEPEEKNDEDDFGYWCRQVRR